MVSRRETLSDEEISRRVVWIRKRRSGTDRGRGFRWLSISCELPCPFRKGKTVDSDEALVIYKACTSCCAIMGISSMAARHVSNVGCLLFCRQSNRTVLVVCSSRALVQHPLYSKEISRLTGTLPKDKRMSSPFCAHCIRSSITLSLSVMAKACMGRVSAVLAELSSWRPVSGILRTILQRRMCGPL